MPWMDGWYAASITLTNGKVHRARDYVTISRLASASGQTPGDDTELPPPLRSWHGKVFRGQLSTRYSSATSGITTA